MNSVKNTCSYEEINMEKCATVENKNNLSWRNFMRQMLVCTTTWTIYFLYGLQLGAPTVLIPQLREANSTTVIDDELASWITSIFSIGGIPWVVFLPIIVQKIGRKKTFILVCIIAFIGVIIVYLSKTVTQFLVGAFISGILLGHLSSISPLIIAEYSSTKYRGIYLTIKSASVFWGMWIANIIGTFWHWQNIYILSLVCNAYTILSFAWPESPTWLAQNRRFEDCALSHRKLKGTSKEAEKELNHLINTYKCEQNETKPKTIKKYLDTLFCKAFYKPLCLVLLLGMLYHVIGKIICSMYATQLLEKITGSKTAAYNGMLILDGVSVLSAYCGCVLSRYYKRRVLLFSTSIITITILYILSLYLFLVSKSVVSESNFISLSLLSIFSLTACCGPMILVSSVYGEIILIKYQLLSSIIYGCFVTMLMTVSLKASLLLFKLLTLPGTFLFFAILSTFSIVLLYLYLPETKNKSIQEIQEYFVGTSQISEDQTLMQPLGISN